MTDDRDRSAAHPTSGRALVLLLALAGWGGLAAQEEDVERRQRLEFLQEKVAVHMRELEDRMFQLADLIRDVAPDHAARLVLGLQRSREQLLVEGMEEVREAIKAGKLQEAEEAQRQVVFRLKELRDLLLSTDLDLLLKLERLRKLNAAIASVKSRIEEQERLAVASAAQNEKPTDLEGQARDQRQVRGKTELDGSAVGEISTEEMTAERDLQAAAQEMRKAEERLRAKDAAGAAEKQRGAGSRLRTARDDLGVAREALLRELQEYLRRALIEALLQMADQQVKINGSVRKHLERSARGRPPSEADFKRLEDQQIEISTKARDIIQLMHETEYSLAMPVAVAFFRELSEGGTTSFRKQVIDPDVLGRGEELVADVEICINILTEEAKWAKKAPPDDDDAYHQIKLLTEVQTLRMAQERIRVTTDALAKKLGGEAGEQYRVATASRWEKEIGSVTQRLHERGDNRFLGKPDDPEKKGEIF